MTETIKTDFSSIGYGHPVYIIAEVGTTALGDLDRAISLIKEAARAGADAVKFQLIDPEQISNKEAVYEIKTEGKSEFVNMYEMFKKLAFKSDEWHEISKTCKAEKVDFFSTVDFVDGVDLLQSLDVPIMKIGAWDTTYIPLIEKIGKTQKPLMVDLGPTTLEEMQQLEEYYLKAGGTALLYLHDFHTDIDLEMNMSAIKYLDELNDWPFGYSSPAKDHDLDILALGMGAQMLEKRLILDASLKTFHAHESLEPDDFAQWVKRIRRLENTIGQKTIKPTQNDLSGKEKYYRSVCTLSPIKAGEIFSEDNLDGKRPGTGLPTSMLKDIWGKPAKADLAADTLLTEEDF